MSVLIFFSVKVEASRQGGSKWKKLGLGEMFRLKSCCSLGGFLLVGWLFGGFVGFFLMPVTCTLFFLATLRGLSDLSSPTRDRTCAPCSGSVES